jgi:hypothetical protein
MEVFMAQRNGRTPPIERLHDFTFPDTGRSVQIRKVSTLLRAEIRRQIVRQPAFVEPKPPQSEVDYGEGKIMIANPQHPIYQQLLRDWRERVQDEIGTRLKQIVIRRAVVCTVDEAAVNRARVDALEDGIDLGEYDDH